MATLHLVVGLRLKIVSFPRHTQTLAQRYSRLSALVPRITFSRGMDRFSHTAEPEETRGVS